MEAEGDGWDAVKRDKAPSKLLLTVKGVHLLSYFLLYVQ